MLEALQRYNFMHEEEEKKALLLLWEIGVLVVLHERVLHVGRGVWLEHGVSLSFWLANALS